MVRSKTQGAEVEGPTEYELEVQRNKEANKALMATVMKGSLIPLAPSQVQKSSVTPKAKKPVHKRKAEPVEPTRRSSRVSKQVITHQELPDDSEHDLDLPIKERKKTVSRTMKPKRAASSEEEEGKLPNKAPRTNGKVFGAIEGIEVGKWWAFRDECGRAGVHPPTVAGIYGGADVGAYSVAVSAGYPEDMDLGDTFTYTGSGGRELKKKNLRTAPQSSDQTLVRGNAALDKSAQTGNPVRVIRGYKAALGPATGYRYDGLYKVVRSYTALNSEGKYLVYKFDFERLPGQPPVDYGAKERALAEEEAKAAEGEAEAAEGNAKDAKTTAEAMPTPPGSGDETK
ncbi:histone-lysine N-methyltransferase [Sphaerosporella brunnea]|uniref:Histone-lysine N-methyltransferase n=1 Tax=Sphaerosporella brunnea TaxID=1250544 RepID=A0A5J5F0X3_9PEZI|nr:histone-lysine N-methyltransferase [Sphaerosporella brunnea]